MASVPLAYSYLGNPPVYGISYEVPNTKAPSVCSFAWDWTKYDANFFNDVRLNKDTIVMHCNIPLSGVSGAGLDMVKSVYIDNSQNYFPLTVTALDTQQTIFCGPLQSGWFQIATNQFNFDVKTFLGITSILPIGVTNAPVQIVFCNTVVPGNISSATTFFDIFNKLDVLHQDLLNIENNYLQTLINMNVNAASANAAPNVALPAALPTLITANIIPAFPADGIVALTGYSLEFSVSSSTFLDFWLQDTTTGLSFILWRGNAVANTPYAYNNVGMNYQLIPTHSYSFYIDNGGAASSISGVVNINYTHY